MRRTPWRTKNEGSRSGPEAYRQTFAWRNRADFTGQSTAGTWRGSRGGHGSCNTDRRRRRWAGQRGRSRRSRRLQGRPFPQDSGDAWQGRRKGRHAAYGTLRPRSPHPGMRHPYSRSSGRRRPGRHRFHMRRPGRRHPDTHRPGTHRRLHAGPDGHKGHRSWRGRGDRRSNSRWTCRTRRSTERNWRSVSWARVPEGQGGPTAHRRRTPPRSPRVSVVPAAPVEKTLRA